MKNIKRLFLGLLTLLLSVSSLNIVKADNTEGSILVNGTKEGKIYEIYKILDLTYSGSNVAYTIDEDWTAFFEGTGKNYIVDENSGTLNPITIGSETKYINITETNINEFTKAALIYAASLDEYDDSKTADAESLTFTNLELGYYLVYPRGATNVTGDNGSICSITSTVPTATVNIKADYPIIDKEVDDWDADVGQLVEFTITGEVPDTTGFTSYTYKIDDTMTEGLLFNSEISNFKVLFGTEVINVTPTYTDNGFTLTFNMVNYQDYVGEAITITYNAKVTEAAVNSSTTKNSVTLTYSNNPKEDTIVTTTPIEIPVYSSELNIDKIDANDETKTLAGAIFVIKDEEGKYYRAEDSEGNIITDVSTTENVALVRWVDTEEATKLVTGIDGKVTFEGIENGTYYIVEVEAPDGYNRLTGPVTVKVGYNEEGTNLLNLAVSHTETVKNSTGTALPQTGGIGTKLFIIIGFILAVTSAIVLIVNKRMTKEN